jgi:hypothetical protein
MTAKVSGNSIILYCSAHNSMPRVIKAAAPLVTTLINPIKILTESSVELRVPRALSNFLAVISIKIAIKNMGNANKVTFAEIIFSKLINFALWYNYR